jgi:hypothetical protein
MHYSRRVWSTIALTLSVRRRVARSPRSISLFYYHRARVLSRYVYKKNCNNLQSHWNLNILKLNLKNRKCYLRYWCFNLNIIFYLLVVGLQPGMRVCPQRTRRGRPRFRCLHPRISVIPNARCLHARASASQRARWQQPEAPSCVMNIEYFRDL